MFLKIALFSLKKNLYKKKDKSWNNTFVPKSNKKSSVYEKLFNWDFPLSATLYISIKNLEQAVKF